VSSPLQPIIMRHINAHGPMGLDQYMSLCLQHPEHGYYISSNPLSSRRDFVTAPELGSLFGDLLGAWFAQQVTNLELPEFDLVELGPGSGRLSRLLIRALDSFHPGKMRQLHLVETSPHLRLVQKERLAAYDPIHHDHVGKIHPTRPMLLMANEFFDALPMRLFEFDQGGYHELLVGIQQKNLGFTRNIYPIAAHHIPPYAQGNMVVEHSPQSHVISQEIHSMLRIHGGVVLIVDYGQIAPRTSPSIRGFHQHEVTGIFEQPGLTDITYNVDFRMFVDDAAHEGLMTHPPITQGDFLNACGLEERLAQQLATKPNEQKHLRDEAKMLAQKDHMGECFLVHAAAGAMP